MNDTQNDTIDNTQPNGQYTPPQVTVLAEVNLNASVTKRIAEEVMNQKTLLDVWTKLAQYAVQIKGLKKFESAEDYQKGLETFGLFKADVKSLEDVRKKAVAFHVAYCGQVNGLIKPLQEQLAGYMQTLDRLCIQWREVEAKRLAEDAAKAQEALEDKAAETHQETAVDNGVGIVVPASEVQKELPLEVPRTVVTEGGTRVQAKKSVEVEVVDKLAFLKAIISKQERNAFLTVDLVSIDIPALKRVAEANKKRKIAGVVFKKVEKMV